MYKIDVDTNYHTSIRQKWTPSHLYETDLDTDCLTCKTYKKDEDINCPICLRHVDTNCHTCIRHADIDCPTLIRQTWTQYHRIRRTWTQTVSLT